MKLETSIQRALRGAHKETYHITNDDNEQLGFCPCKTQQRVVIHVNCHVVQPSQYHTTRSKGSTIQVSADIHFIINLHVSSSILQVIEGDEFIIDTFHLPSKIGHLLRVLWGKVVKVLEVIGTSDLHGHDQLTRVYLHKSNNNHHLDSCFAGAR